MDLEKDKNSFIEDNFSFENSSNINIKKEKTSDKIYFLFWDIKDKLVIGLKKFTKIVADKFYGFENRTKVVIVSAFIVMCIVSTAILTVKIINISTNENNVEVPLTVDTTEYIVDNNQEQFTNLRLKYNANQDIVAYISIFDTYINSPIVKTDNNVYYQDHDLYNTENIDGAVYFDAISDIENFGQNTIIYGRTDIEGKQFFDLTMFANENFYNTNRYINLNTVYNNSIWKVFSFYTIEDDNFYLKNKFTDEEFKTFIAGTRNMSIYPIDVEINKDDKILTLTSQKLDGVRYVLHAKLEKLK